MSKRWLRYLLPGILLAALVITFVWMQLPQSFGKVIGFDEDCTFYAQSGDAESIHEVRNAPPEQAAMEPLPASLKDCTFRRWGYRRTIDPAPGESVYFLRVHAYSPGKEWMGEVPVVLRSGGMLYKPFGKEGYLWYGISNRDIGAVREDLKALRVLWSMTGA